MGTRRKGTQFNRLVFYKNGLNELNAEKEKGNPDGSVRLRCGEPGKERSEGFEQIRDFLNQLRV